MLASPAINIVNMIVRVPAEILSNIYEAIKLKMKLTATVKAIVLSLLAGGIITARNIPYKATLKALMAEVGNILPAIIPKAVPIDQPGKATNIAP